MLMQIASGQNGKEETRPISTITVFLLLRWREVSMMLEMLVLTLSASLLDKFLIFVIYILMFKNILNAYLRFYLLIDLFGFYYLRNILGRLISCLRLFSR